MFQMGSHGNDPVSKLPTILDWNCHSQFHSCSFYLHRALQKLDDIECLRKSGPVISHIGLVDYDTVELGNLHRQVLHNEEKIGMHKVVSIAESLKLLNSNVRFTTYHLLLDSKNALEIIKEYNIVVDCTDNVATRYLLNDSCVLLKKPLVSGSALRFEGQLTVYNYEGGPCYRCIFPTPPPPQTVTNCSEGGVLGVVPGVIGNLQALEVLKMVTKIGDCYSQKLLLLDGLSGTFRTVRLRGRRRDCAVCGENPTITELIDYPKFCGSCPSDKDRSVNILDHKDRMTSEEYKMMVDSSTPHVLVDVREEVQYDICSLPHSINIPISTMGGPVLQDKMAAPSPQFDKCLKNITSAVLKDSQECRVVVICRRGNDSQFAVKKLQTALKESLAENKVSISVKDVIGGLESWSNNVDPSFPKY